MNHDEPDLAQGPLTAALAASNVGTWEWLIETDSVVACPITANLFGIAPGEAAGGSPLRRYLAAVHADDRERLHRSIRDRCESGGLFVAEYRTVPAPDSARWLLARGRFEFDEACKVTRARGIVIDISESRQDGTLEGAPFIAYETNDGSVLDRLSARAIELHRLAQALDARHRSRLTPVLDILLLVLGQQLGASLLDEPSARDSRLH